MIYRHFSSIIPVMKKIIFLLTLTLFTLTACSSGEDGGEGSKERGKSASEVVRGYSKTLSKARGDAEDVSDKLTERLSEQEKALNEAAR